MTGHPAPAVLAHELYRFYRAGDEETPALRGVSLTVAAGSRMRGRAEFGWDDKPKA